MLTAEAQRAQRTMNDRVDDAGRLNELRERIISCALEVHRQLGPGLLESVYEAALAVELELAGMRYERQKPLPVRYSGSLSRPRNRRVSLGSTRRGRGGHRSQERRTHGSIVRCTAPELPQAGRVSTGIAPELQIGTSQAGHQAARERLPTGVSTMQSEPIARLSLRPLRLCG